MTDEAKVPFYAKPNEHFHQGDIFRVELVTPITDDIQRIFRTTDGKHGSVVFDDDFDGENNAHVFSRTEINELLTTIPKTAFHTEPFSRTQDNSEEMVVVFARLLKYFIVASNTCNVCGIQKAPLPYVTILPVTPLHDICKETVLPFANSDSMTIHNFVSNFLDDKGTLNGTSEIDYASTLRSLIQTSLDSQPVNPIKKNVSTLKKFLTEYHKKGFMFSLPECKELNLPECCADFTTVFTIPISKLENLRTLRIATLSAEFLPKFSKSFGDFFADIATPIKMEPEGFSKKK